MTKAGASRVATVALPCLLLALWPAVALACPMCFDGGNSNKDAFLWGSLFLMIVPVTAIGGLAYWAYRRMRASEARQAARTRADDERQPLRLVGR
jgi:uncharacterized membrane protein YebE (DUF533 family)